MKPIVEAQIYDRGTAGVLEDGLYAELPIVGVYDGVSAPFNDQHPPFLFDGLTGGQMAGEIIRKTFIRSKETDIEKILLEANRKIGQIQSSAGLLISDSSCIGGATFIFAQIEDEKIRIVQGGDCMAFWIKRSGEVEITHNTFRPFEMELRNKIAELMKETNNRKEMWRRFYPFLCQKRKENTNVWGRCAVLNGQPEVLKCWQKYELSANDVSALVLFTDGFAPASEGENEQLLAQKLAALYNEGRLMEILFWARGIEGKGANTSHETFSEATAVAVRFMDNPKKNREVA